MKKYIITFAIILPLLIIGTILYFILPEQTFGGTTLTVPRGGTGATSFAAGECLVGNGTGAVTTVACSSGPGTETDPIWSAASTSYVLQSVTSTWNTAYSWGNHALAGYLTTSTGLTTANFASANISQWTNNSGYITTSTGLTVANFASNNISQWTNNVGYITTTPAETDPVWVGVSSTVNGFAKERNLKITITSSTISSIGSLTATTTVNIPVDGRAMSLTNIYCYTDSGTTTIWFTDGANATESISCGSTVSQDDGSITNGSFTALEIPKLGVIMNSAGTPNQVSITGRYTY